MIENLSYETTLRQKGFVHIAGVDEAGRGPLAGPVVAAAVIFPADVCIHGIDDSKKLTPGKREELFNVIHEKALCVGTGIISNEIIDEINILQATLRAMEQAVSSLSPLPHHLLIDGHIYHDDRIPFTTLIGGDAKCFSIAAASIIAKVTRDRMMLQYDEQFPEYGFAKHKGYGTRDHIEAIKKFGPSVIHRSSFHVASLEVTDEKQ
ncbi:MAG: ribonuclease HII [Bacteroidota bacterium]